jgi:hypothetical protein
MGTICKALGMLSCGFLVCLEFSTAQANTAASTAKDMKHAEQAEQTEQKDTTAQKPSHIIQGDVLRMENGHYVVRQKNGKEVRVDIDHTTEIMRQVKHGDRVVANVDDQNHALWISSVP